MSVENILNDIFKTGKVSDSSGKQYSLNSNIDVKEGEFIKNIMINFPIQKSIEIGCAYGISSLFICGYNTSKDPKHVIIDPFQSTDWNSIGVSNLKKANIDFFTLLEKPSELALPQLLMNEEKFDFAFIDGWHTLDHTLIDFFYINRLLNVGGVVVIDDVGMPGIRKIMRYILNYPCYEFVGAIQIKNSFKRSIFKYVIEKPLSLIASLFPKNIAFQIFSSNIVMDEKKLKLNSSMVALRKIKQDERPWNWFKEF